MSSHLATSFICFGGLVFFFCGISSKNVDDIPDTELRNMVKHSLDYVDNDPEFLVGAQGLDNPLCFTTEGKTDQVVRLLQDPESGIIINARIFYDSLTNKSYIGAVMIGQGNFRILGKQRVVIVNNTKFDWGDVRAMNFDGNRVVIRENIVAVTFKNRGITLVIQRHFATPDDFIDYDVLDRDYPSRPSPGKTNVTDASARASQPDDSGYVMPVIGYEEHESLINHFLSSKRRRSLLLKKFFGINQDSAVVRNLFIELDTEGRKKRDMKKIADADNETNWQTEKKLNAKEQEQRSQKHETRDEESFGSTSKLGKEQTQRQQKHRKHHHLQQRSHLVDRHKRESDDDIMEGDVEKRRNRTAFLGVYISDSKDLSNRTHGLLGQFLFKNITQEKLRYSNGRMKARLFVHGNPNRRTIALLTLRRNMAMNTTKSCWKIRHQGRDVLDGKYSDYLVPALRYSGLKELPPPAPL